MVYDTIKQASAATGISPKKLRLAKNDLGAPGFSHGRVNWDTFEQWYNIGANKVALENLFMAESGGKGEDNRSVEEIKRNLLLKKEVLDDLEIQKRKGEYLSPLEVKEFLINIGTAQSSTLKKLPAELAPKLTGKGLGEIEQILTNAVVEVMGLFNIEFEKFIK